MSYRDQPRHLVDGGSEVVVVAFVGRSRMHGRTHANPVDRREIFPCDIALQSEGRFECAFGAPEDDAKGIADRFENDAVVAFDRLPQDDVVPA